MSVARSRVVAELPLPLAPGAEVLDAIAIAVAIEDACGITVPDWAIDVAHLGRRETVEATLDAILGTT